MIHYGVMVKPELPLQPGTDTRQQEYLELTMKQTISIGWTEKDRLRLQALKNILGIDPQPSQEQKVAQMRQTTAGTCLKSGELPQPPLTSKEKKLIAEANDLFPSAFSKHPR